MPGRVSEFRTDEDRVRYHEMYDRFLTKHWPVHRVELDVPTVFGTTHVRRSGSGDGSPLVLLHPTSGSSLGWHSIIEPLSRRHPVYTPDTIGTIGKSTQTVPIRAPEDLVQWLDQVLDGLDLTQFHLLGYSEGGWIAGLHAALTEEPTRLLSLTLIEPGGAIERIPNRTLAALIYRAGRTLTAKDKPRAIREFNNWMNGDLELSDDEVELVLTAFRSFRQRLPKPSRLSDSQVRRIAAPTLLLLAGDTRIYDPNRVAKRASQLLSRLEIDITPNAGHGLPFQYPERTVSRILRFIESDARWRSDQTNTQANDL